MAGISIRGGRFHPGWRFFSSPARMFFRSSSFISLMASLDASLRPSRRIIVVVVFFLLRFLLISLPSLSSLCELIDVQSGWRLSEVGPRHTPDTADAARAVVRGGVFSVAGLMRRFCLAGAFMEATSNASHLLWLCSSLFGAV